jgi:ribosome-binding factor A
MKKKKDDFIKGFKRANKRIRKEIAQRVQLKYTPSLSFVFDDTIKEIRKLDELFSSNKVSNDIKS